MESGIVSLEKFRKYNISQSGEVMLLFPFLLFLMVYLSHRVFEAQFGLLSTLTAVNKAARENQIEVVEQVEQWRAGISKGLDVKVGERCNWRSVGKEPMIRRGVCGWFFVRDRILHNAELVGQLYPKEGFPLVDWGRISSVWPECRLRDCLSEESSGALVSSLDLEAEHYESGSGLLATTEGLSINHLTIVDKMLVVTARNLMIGTLVITEPKGAQVNQEVIDLTLVSTGGRVELRGVENHTKRPLALRVISWRPPRVPRGILNHKNELLPPMFMGIEAILS